MQTFANPAIPPDAPDWFKDYALQLQRSIAKAAASANPYSAQQYLHAEPSRILAGMEVLADGTDWNPGSGAGKYRRDEANATWVFLG